MYCLFCGTNLPEEALFCFKCGQLTPRGNGESGKSESIPTFTFVSSPSDPYSPRPSTSYGPPPPEGGAQNPYVPLSPYVPLAPPPPRHRRFSPGLLKVLVSGMVMILLLSGVFGALLILKQGAQPRSPVGPLISLQSTAHKPTATLSTIVQYQAEDGHLWHTIRQSDGSWSKLDDVNGQLAIPGPVRAVAATSCQVGETQYMFVTADGHLWHTIQQSNGSWSGLEDISAKIAIPGPVRAVAATSSQAGEAQYMFATADGHLWHTIRYPNGSWSGLGDVNGVFAIPGPVRAVAATSSKRGEAQYMFATADGHLWHTIRYPNGSWSGLGDVNAQFTIPGPVQAIAATSCQPGVAQYMFNT